MNEFKQYKRKGLSEMRQILYGEDLTGISISDPDKELMRDFPSVFAQGYIAREAFEAAKELSEDGAECYDKYPTFESWEDYNET